MTRATADSTTVTPVIPGRSPYTITVGDPVKVWGGRTRSYDGVVRKIGHTLIHIESPAGQVAYRKDDQQRRDGYPGYFKTVDQVIDLTRRAAATDALRFYGVGIELHRRDTWTTDELAELAAYVIELREPK